MLFNYVRGFEIRNFFLKNCHVCLLTFVLGVSLRTNKQLKHFKTMKKFILSIVATLVIGLLSFSASAQTTYRGYTDSFGNTTVTGSNGYRSTSYTDSFGNTTTRTNNGVTYNTRTDSFGNTTTTGSNGYRSTSYTDSFGNTTTRTNNGTTYRSYTDSFGNTTTTGSNGYRATSQTDSFGNTTIRIW